MTQPSKSQVALSDTHYHYISRCVGRAYLNPLVFSTEVKTQIPSYNIESTTLSVCYFLILL